VQLIRFDPTDMTVGDSVSIEETLRDGFVTDFGYPVPLSSLGAFAIYSGGRSFTTVENAGYTETKLVELTDDGFVQRAKVKGLLDGIVRVR
jgi:hypothetical protein